MAENCTIDANILIYSVDPRHPTKQRVASEILTILESRETIIATIALAEFYWALSRKRIAGARLASQHLEDMAGLFIPVSYGRDDVLAAAKLAEEGRFSFWDAVMLSSVMNAGCTVMLSEDMHDGARLGNIVVRNPFGAKGLSDAATEALGV